MTPMVLPSLDVCLHELHQMVVRQELSKWDCAHIGIAARAATDESADALYRETWVRTGAALLLSRGATFPPGVFAALVSMILPTQGEH